MSEYESFEVVDTTGWSIEIQAIGEYYTEATITFPDGYKKTFMWPEPPSFQIYRTMLMLIRIEKKVAK